MEKKKRKVPSYIKPAGWLKDSLAHVIDFTFMLILGVILFFTVGSFGIYNGIYKGAEVYKAYQDYCVSSGLYYFDESEKCLSYKPTITGDNVEEYKTAYLFIEGKTWDYFYTKVAQNDDFAFLSSDGFLSTSERGSSLYLQDAGKWIYKNVFKVDNGSKFFVAPSDSGFKYDSMPVLNNETQTVVDEGGASALAKLKLIMGEIYNVNSKTTSYQLAHDHLNHQPKGMSLSNRHFTAIFRSFWPSIIASPFIFFFLIPAFTKHGKTLGKMIMKIEVISSSGYDPKKWQILLHYALIYLPYLALLIQHPLITLPLFGFYFVIDYMVMVLHKNHQGFHDLLSKTIVIKASSLVFKDENARRIYIENHPNSLAALEEKKEMLNEDGEVSAISNEAAIQIDSVFDSRDLALKARRKESEGKGKEGE